MPPRVLVLVATIPVRKASCERLLSELTRQSRQPDGVILCLDGYGDAPQPQCPLLIVAVHRTAQLLGPGQRWSAVRGLPPEDIVVNLDDDVFTRRAPDLIKALVDGVQEGGAAGAFGRTPDGKRAPPGNFSRGDLIFAGACGLAVRAGYLEGLQDLAHQVQLAYGFNALGPCGDDDGLIAALLWKKGIAIRHAATGVINAAAGTQRSSQTKARLALGEPLDAQKKAIARLTGWPWVSGRRSFGGRAAKVSPSTAR